MWSICSFYLNATSFRTCAYFDIFMIGLFPLFVRACDPEYWLSCGRTGWWRIIIDGFGLLIVRLLILRVYLYILLTLHSLIVMHIIFIIQQWIHKSSRLNSLAPLSKNKWAYPATSAKASPSLQWPNSYWLISSSMRSPRMALLSNSIRNQIYHQLITLRLMQFSQFRIKWQINY